MRPTGPTHLGHLVGALDNWVSLQDRYDCYFFVADLHALTSDYADPSRVRDWAMENLACWLAAGVDPDRSVLFVQSDLAEHSELALLLSMIVPLPWLERVPTYKEQQQQIRDRDLATYGFLGYPVLQAADILIYRAAFVPVGEDQVAHLELTREIARRFNNLYGETLLEPQPLLTEAARLPGTDGRKMSKSYGNAIGLGEEPAGIESALRGMITDPARKRRRDAGNPYICPVYHMHRVFSEDGVLGRIEDGCPSAGLGCVECKKWASGALESRLGPLREKRAELLARPDRLREILEAGREKARAVAAETMARVREKMGLDYSGLAGGPPS